VGENPPHQTGAKLRTDQGAGKLFCTDRRLQISIHQPVLPYYAALYMQKSRQTLLPGLMLFYKVY
jgi:hypothetical protein